MAAEDIEAHPLKLMECPVCYNVFQSKIFMCIQGHNICETCRPNVINCPICRNEFTGARNHLVEQLLTKSLQYNCKYKEYGCPDKLPLHKIQIHQTSCNFRLYQCLVPLCLWEGRCMELKQHIISMHRSSVSTSKETLFSDREYSNSEKDYSDFLFIDLFNELFAYFYKREHTGKILFDVIYIGSKENAGNFRYLLAFQNEDRSKKMQLVSNVSADIKKAFSEKCLSIDYSTCKQFVRYNGILQYFLKIEKQNWKRNEIFEEVKDKVFK
ncbi:hypothetical protein R5R35_010226 [Gryllus longicercus]|uniref:RING-type E3 ubiquitin transferase n=1 Tax=Gryllus longicercus TaxID=2509291 RepID=A0AAN9VU84_9ORTH